MAYNPFAPAPAGWYAREGDPPSVLRWWNGEHWTREVYGAPLSSGLLVEALVDGHEWERAPFVPSDVVPGSTRRPVAAWKPPKVRPRFRLGGKTFWIVVATVGVVALSVFAYIGSFATGNQSSDGLAIGRCVTLSAPALAPDHDHVSWTADDCQTTAGGAVSFMVTEMHAGDVSCGKKRGIQFFFGEENGKRTGIESTYCLMENLAVGECVYYDSLDFEFDVPCTDARAVVKVTKRVEQGSGVTCAPSETVMSYDPPGRTYCLAKP